MALRGLNESLTAYQRGRFAQQRWPAAVVGFGCLVVGIVVLARGSLVGLVGLGMAVFAGLVAWTGFRLDRQIEDRWDPRGR